MFKVRVFAFCSFGVELINTRAFNLMLFKVSAYRSRSLAVCTEFIYLPYNRSSNWVRDKLFCIVGILYVSVWNRSPDTLTAFTFCLEYSAYLSPRSPFALNTARIFFDVSLA